MGVNKRISVISYAVTFLMFAFVIVWGKFYLHPGDEMGFLLISFYFLLPFTSLISGFLLGVKDGFLKWLYPVIFGAFGAVLPGIIFKWFSMDALFVSALQAFLGLGIGLLVSAIKKRNIENKRKVVFVFCYTVTFLLFTGITVSGLAINLIDRMGYFLLNYYFILPATSFIMGILLSLYNAYWKWLYPVVFGIAGCIIPLIIFDRSFDVTAMFFSAVPAVLGLALGVLIVFVKRVVKAKKQ